MHFHERFSYDQSFDKVWSMFRDPSFTQQRLELAQLTELQVDISEADDALTVTATGTADPSVIPEQARKFVPGGVKVQWTEDWKLDSQGSASGTLSVKLSGAPVKISAKSQLEEVEEGTSRTVEGELTVSIPLLGARLEKEAIRMVPRLIEAERSAAANHQS